MISGEQQPSVQLPQTKLFINNEWVDSISKKKFKTVNPLTEEVICEVTEGDAADVDVAVVAAREAFENGPWSKYTGAQRSKLMFKLADLIDRDKEIIATLESTDMGKPRSASLGYDVVEGGETVRFFGGLADKIHGQTIPVQDGMTVYTRHEAVGVVGVITPWNYPFLIMCWKIGPALAAGCTIVAKQSEITPLTALYLCQLIKEAGFPPGVFNLISGYGHTVGHAISVHQDIDKISFTGSTRVGRLIMEASGKSNLKKVTLELGGKSPNIVLNDADLDKAVPGAIMALFSNMGQCCCAGSRLFVQEEIYDKFVERFLAKAKELKVGNPFTDVDQGPLASKEHFDRVQGFLATGKKEGATVLLGGNRHGDKGYFIEPTIFTNVKDDMCVGKDEIFGPVVCIFKFKTIEEVLQRANNSTYGLAAAVWTTNISKALTMSTKLKAGTVWINEYNYINHLIPFGGYKQSGFGKDLSVYAVQEYLSVKAVTINHTL